MKLGATITSERGKAVTKTGNERLEIKINVQNTVIGTLYIEENAMYDDWYTVLFKSEHDQCVKVIDEWNMEEGISPCNHSYIDADNFGVYGKEVCTICGHKQHK